MSRNEVPMVYIVEDDEDASYSMAAYLRENDFEVRAFSSAEDFLDAPLYKRPGCVVIDIRLNSGASGLVLQQSLRQRGITLPVIVISGYANVQTAVECMRSGALTLLEKPIAPQVLIQHVSEAIEKDRLQHVISTHLATLQESLEALTSRERTVLDSVLAGRLNKQIATDLNVSQRTIEVDRSRILKKFNASNAAELAVKATELRMLSGFSYRIDQASLGSYRANALHQVTI